MNKLILIALIFFISCGEEPQPCFVCEITTDSNHAVYDDCIGLQSYDGPEWVITEYAKTDTFCDESKIAELTRIEREVTAGSIFCPFITRTYVDCIEF